MITRVVKMSFASENVERFLYIFEENNRKIGNSKGCIEVKLFHEEKNPNVFFTISKWKNREDLENYRQSVLFKSTWAKTKVLFNDAPLAWSLEEQILNI
jgi:quinol monooxygenase YgiN